MMRRAVAAAAIAAVAWFALIVVTVAGGGSVAGPLPWAKPAVTVPDSGEPLVIIGMSGVTWDDVDSRAAPHLDAFADEAAVGNLVVRTVNSVACPADGWLTMGAGRRAAGGCDDIAEPVDSHIPGWDAYATAAHESSYNPRLGQLSESLEGVDAVAVGPGAALALADPDGAIDQWYPLTDLEQALRVGAEVVVIDIGNGDLMELDGRFGTVIDAVEAQVPDARILVVSLADAQRPESQLQLIMLDSAGPGALHSAAIRQPSVVQTADLFPTILQHLGIDPPANIAGAPIAVAERADARGLVSDKLDQSNLIRPLMPPFSIAWGILWLGTGAAVVVALRRSRPFAPWMRYVALMLAGLLPASVLAQAVPWWRWPFPSVTVIALTFAIAAVLALTAVALARRYAPRAAVAESGILAGLATAILGLDILLGTNLQILSFYGTPPQVGGRFFGMNNMMFTAFAVNALVAAMAWAVGEAGCRAKATRIAAVAILVVFIDGWPSLGADVGGPIALVPAFILLGLWMCGRKLTWLHALAIAAVTLLVVAAFAVVDYARPVVEQSHLGRFVHSVLEGEAWPIIWRKLEATFAQFTAVPILTAVFAVLVAAALALYQVKRQRGPRRERGPLPIPGFQPRIDGFPALAGAILVALVIGAALNDTGLPILIVGLILFAQLCVPMASRVHAPSVTQSFPDKHGM